MNTPNPNPSPELKAVETARVRVRDSQISAGGDNVEVNFRALMDLFGAITALSQTLPAPGEVVSEALKILRSMTAHASEDADEIGQSNTATKAAAALEAYWARVGQIWRESAFPKSPEHAGLLADEMDKLLSSSPTPATVAAANDEGVADYPDELLDRVAEAITRAQCPDREGPYGGYDYGHRREDDLPRDGRYVVRDFRDVRSGTFGAWVHQTPDVKVHEAAFDRLTKRHIARAALDAAAIRLLSQGGVK